MAQVGGGEQRQGVRFGAYGILCFLGTARQRYKVGIWFWQWVGLELGRVMRHSAPYGQHLKFGRGWGLPTGLVGAGYVCVAWRRVFVFVSGVCMCVHVCAPGSGS